MGKHSAKKSPWPGLGLAALAAVALGTAGAALIVTGLDEEPPAPAKGRPLARPVEAAAPLHARSEPVRVTIPAIGVDAGRLEPLQVDAGRRLPAPRRHDAIGWHAAGPWPGQAGAAVLVGHVDSGTGPAIFHRLGALRPGDVITIGRAAGPDAVFTVHRVERYRKEEFPTRRVYGPTGNRAELRLITCGGAFDKSSGAYRDNTVVYATLTGLRRPGS